MTPGNGHDKGRLLRERIFFFSSADGKMIPERYLIFLTDVHSIPPSSEETGQAGPFFIPCQFRTMWFGEARSALQSIRGAVGGTLYCTYNMVTRDILKYNIS